MRRDDVSSEAPTRGVTLECSVADPGVPVDGSRFDLSARQPCAGGAAADRPFDCRRVAAAAGMGV